METTISSLGRDLDKLWAQFREHKLRTADSIRLFREAEKRLATTIAAAESRSG